jgi:hypothetical protein
MYLLALWLIPYPTATLTALESMDSNAGMYAQIGNIQLWGVSRLSKDDILSCSRSQGSHGEQEKSGKLTDGMKIRQTDVWSLRLITRMTSRQKLRKYIIRILARGTVIFPCDRLFFPGEYSFFLSWLTSLLPRSCQSCSVQTITPTRVLFNMAPHIWNWPHSWDENLSSHRRGRVINNSSPEPTAICVNGPSHCLIYITAGSVGPLRNNGVDTQSAYKWLSLISSPHFTPPGPSGPFLYVTVWSQMRRNALTLHRSIILINWFMQDIVTDNYTRKRFKWAMVIDMEFRTEIW